MLTSFLKQNKKTLLLLALDWILILFYFRGFFQNSLMTGWDSPGHYYLLQRATENFPNILSIYDKNWYGGMPLFTLYSPAFYWILAFLWFITFKLIPLFLLYRMSMLLMLLALPVVFWWFVKTFIDRRNADMALLFILFYVFFPISLSFTGIGGFTLPYIGFINSFFGLLLCLIGLILLKHILYSKRKYYYAFWFIITISLLVLTHILGVFFSFVLMLTYIFINYRESLKNIKLLLLSGAFIFLLTSFWWIPFLRNFSSSSGQVIPTNACLPDMLLALLPVNPYALFNPSFVLFFRFWTIFLLFLIIVFLIARKFDKAIQPILWMFIIEFFVFATNVIPVITVYIPKLHYYRVAPYLYIMFITLLAYTFRYLLDRFPKFNFHLYLLLFISITNAFVLSDVYMYEYIDQPTWTAPRRINKNMNFNEFPVYKEASEIAKFLNSADVQRPFFQNVDITMIDKLGSNHFFDYELPGKYNKPILLGLTAESSPLTPYIMGLVNSITRNYTQTWGDWDIVSLGFHHYQPLDSQLERMLYIGSNTIVATEKPFANNLDHSEMVTNTKRGNAFSVYKIKGEVSLINVPKYKPIYYVDEDSKIMYSDVASVFFVSKTAYDYPIVKIKLNQLNKVALNDSVVIAPSKIINSNTIAYFTKHNVKLIVLDIGENINNQTFQNGVVVNNFKPLHNFIHEGHLGDEPESWGKLRMQVTNLIQKYDTSVALPSYKDIPNGFIVNTQRNTDIILKYNFYNNLKIVNDKSASIFEVAPSFIYIYNPNKVENLKIEFR